MQLDNDLHNHAARSLKERHLTEDYDSAVLYEPMGSMTFLCASKRPAERTYFERSRSQKPQIRSSVSSNSS